jgi:hypothetical protein
MWFENNKHEYNGINTKMRHIHLAVTNKIQLICYNNPMTETKIQVASNITLTS